MTGWEMGRIPDGQADPPRYIARNRQLDAPKAGSLAGVVRRENQVRFLNRQEKVKSMKSIKSLVAIACALAFVASVSIARAESCCDKAKAAGKECSHKCCETAKKAGKTCEKCNPKKDK